MKTINSFQSSIKLKPQPKYYMNIYSVAQLCPTFATQWTIAPQAPLFMEFSRQEYWSGLPFLPPGDLPNPGIIPASPALAGGFFTWVKVDSLCGWEAPTKALYIYIYII